MQSIPRSVFTSLHFTSPPNPPNPPNPIPISIPIPIPIPIPINPNSSCLLGALHVAQLKPARGDAARETCKRNKPSRRASGNPMLHAHPFFHWESSLLPAPTSSTPSHPKLAPLLSSPLLSSTTHLRTLTHTLTTPLPRLARTRPPFPGPESVFRIQRAMSCRGYLHIARHPHSLSSRCFNSPRHRHDQMGHPSMSPFHRDAQTEPKQRQETRRATRILLAPYAHEVMVCARGQRADGCTELHDSIPRRLLIGKFRNRGESSYRYLKTGESEWRRKSQPC